jgi:hypothetical protein
MKARLLATALIACPAALPAQDFAERFSIPGRFDAFTTDELGNVYALSADELVLYDAKGRSWLRNSLKTFGRITAIDAFYSLKPMVHAAEQGQVAVLDNTLSVQGSVINLPANGFPQVVLACMSVQNGFWFYDQRDMALLRLDAQLRPLANTGRLDQLLGFAPEPVAMQELDSRLYVNDPRRGIHVFDLFGTYMRTIPIKGARSFEVRGGGITYLDAQGAARYDLRSFAVEPIPLGPLALQARELRVERGSYFLLLHDRIAVLARGAEDR